MNKKLQEVKDKHRESELHHSIWTEYNVTKAMEEYGKYCAEQAWAFVGVKTFNEWWAEFQRKEATEL